MAPTQRGKKRDQVTGVLVNANLCYVFTTKDLAALSGISPADLTAQLGHIAEAQLAATAQPKVVGANAPKPPRVSKRLTTGAVAAAQGSVSTYCAYNKLGTARSAGWRLAKAGNSVAIRSSGKTVTAVVEVDGVLYCWPMNSADFDQYNDELGLKLPSTVTTAAERNRCVRGARFPQPGRISLRLDTGSVFSSFYDSDNPPTTGEWFNATQPLLYGNTPAAAGGG
ncbi:hypothetical protein [Leptolyngbya sp. FACHB-261]|uniref:hypothetical protein n=1 Tax=Leptolyngbya sp. FACHB-261 TaxID=2692806 RepID=UPI001683A0C2|nr:hypothetical protein [Leptolyngbya sp. FACHB-261]MBD2100265.1 hypothetical protein [Leptolyngbya sp. FACHB-261]